MRGLQDLVETVWMAWPCVVICLGPVLLCYLIFRLAIWKRDKDQSIRRRRFRYCKNCDYDLIGSESKQCPECGTTRKRKMKTQTHA